MINVDTVYQTVLALANKEQRGYITPQEFNLYADHAQMAIFEQYFYDLNQFRRQPGSTTKYIDMVDLIEDKLDIFKIANEGVSDGATIENAYRIINVTRGVGDKTKVVEEVKFEDYYKTRYSPLTKATNNRPVYWTITDSINFDPNDGDFYYSYIRRPVPPRWTYTVVNEKPLYDPSIIGTNGHQHFELHESEKNELVNKILQLAGVAVKDYNLAQAAAQEEVKSIQQEKQ